MDDEDRHAREVIKKAGCCPSCRGRKAAFMVAGNFLGLSRHPGPVPIYIAGCLFDSSGCYVHCMICDHQWSSEQSSNPSYVTMLNSPKRYLVLPAHYHLPVRMYGADILKLQSLSHDCKLKESVGAVAFLDKFDRDMIRCGDSIVGRLPPHEIAEICAMGCRYFHIIWDETIDEDWFEQNPDKDVANVKHEVGEFFVTEIRHDGPISKYVDLGGCRT